MAINMYIYCFLLNIEILQVLSVGGNPLQLLVILSNANSLGYCSAIGPYAYAMLIQRMEYCYY